MHRLIFILVLLWSACASREPMGSIDEEQLDLRPIAWNTQAAALGKVMAVADSQDDVAVFGSQGALVFGGGLLVGSDDSVVSWRAAAAVPSLDLPESWLLGVTQLGRIYRLRNRMMLDDVTERFGLAGQPALEAVALSSELTAFALRDKIAVAGAGMSSVWFYNLQARGLTGAAGKLAAYDWMGVVEADFTAPGEARVAKLPLEGVIGAAFDESGELVLVTATEDALYVEREGALVRVWDAPAGVKLTGLASSGRGVWVGIGKELALLRGSQLLRASSDVIPEGGRLIGSPSGDVWVLGGSQLLRMGERAPGGSDEDRWRRTLLPMFQRICRGCHLPGGSAGTDLSTYAQWTARRQLLGQRLIDQVPTPMPPPSVGALTYDELSAVKLWVQAGR